jgi:hypothetical protein
LENLKIYSSADAQKKGKPFSDLPFNLKLKIKLEIQSQSKLNLTVCSKPDGSADRAVDYAELPDVGGGKRHSWLLRSRAAR